MSFDFVDNERRWSEIKSLVEALHPKGVNLVDFGGSKNDGGRLAILLIGNFIEECVLLESHPHIRVIIAFKQHLLDASGLFFHLFLLFLSFPLSLLFLHIAGLPFLNLKVLFLWIYFFF